MEFEQYKDSAIITINSNGPRGPKGEKGDPGEVTQEEFDALKDQVALDKLDYTSLSERVETIIATPAEGISEQEIIDARQGESSLGANLTKVKEQIEDLVIGGTAGIDDTVISSRKVWSSEKTQQEIGNLINIPSTIYTSDSPPPNPSEGDIWFKIISSAPEMPVTDYLFRFDASELQLDDGANVSIWEDMGDNNFNLTPTSTTKPVFLKTGFNGRPTVHLNRIKMKYASIPLSDLNNGTLVMVSEFSSALTSSTDIVGLVSESTDMARITLRGSTSDTTNLISLRVGGTQASTLVLQTNPTVYIGALNNQEGTLYANGIKPTSSGNPVPISEGSKSIIVGNDGFNGKISEVIYYERGLSEQEITELNSYLMQKWGI